MLGSADGRLVGETKSREQKTLSRLVARVMPTVCGPLPAPAPLVLTSPFPPPSSAPPLSNSPRCASPPCQHPIRVPPTPAFPPPASAQILCSPSCASPPSAHVVPTPSFPAPVLPKPPFCILYQCLDPLLTVAYVSRLGTKGTPKVSSAPADISMALRGGVKRRGGERCKGRGKVCGWGQVHGGEGDVGGVGGPFGQEVDELACTNRRV